MSKPAGVFRTPDGRIIQVRNPGPVFEDITEFFEQWDGEQQSGGD